MTRSGGRQALRQAAVSNKTVKPIESHTTKSACVCLCVGVQTAHWKREKQQQRRNKASGMTEVHEGREEETAKKEIKPESKSFWGLKSTTDTPVGTEGTGW